MMLHLARVYAVGAALAAVRAGRCHRVVLAPLQVLQLGRSVAISRKYAQRCVPRGQAVMLACAGCQLASILACVETAGWSGTGMLKQSSTSLCLDAYPSHSSVHCTC